MHQKHVKSIMEVHAVKSGTGKELRQLHYIVIQHLHSLKNIKGDTFESFVSSWIETKLDQASKFAWQQLTSERKDVPSIDELLKFVDGRAQASETSTSRDVERKCPVMERKTKSRTSYQVTTEPVSYTHLTLPTKRIV